MAEDDDLEHLTNILTDEQIAEFKEAFAMFDADGGGTIDQEELESVMKALGQNPSQAEVEGLIDEVEAFNGLPSGEGEREIDFPNFMKLMAKKMHDSDTEKEIVEEFSQQLADKPGSNFISISGLRETLLHLGDDVTAEEIDEMLMEADESKDGFIEIDTFVKTCMLDFKQKLQA